MKKKFTCAVAVILCSVSVSRSQIANCGANTPVFNVDFTGLAASTVWWSPWVVRNDTCCGTVSPDRCIKFIVTTDTNTTGIRMDFIAGAVPPGSYMFSIDCGPLVPFLDTASITPGTHEVTFCKPGNNMNRYSITSIGGPPDIAGKVYVDNNANCSYDNGEVRLSNIPVNLLDNTLSVVAICYTNSNGGFAFNAVPGTYTLEIMGAQASAAGYNLSCPVSGQISVPAIPSLNNDFGLTCISMAFDLQATLTSRIFRPGAHGYFYPRVFNNGCTPVQPQAKLILADTNITYVTSVVPPTLISGDTLIWNVAVSVAGNSGVILDYVTVDVDTTAIIGDTVCATFIVEPIAGDANPANNIVNFCSPILSSWDPNEKEVTPAGNILPNTELTYTIHFQNTGNDTAFDVFLIDTISPYLDITTFRPVFSSHPYSVQVYSGNIVRFTFDNIYLPDSNVNEPSSHGFVIYKIHTLPGLTTGTQITNTASIYFDFNPAVITNTTLNTIDINASVIENTSPLIAIYPNPTMNLLTIRGGQRINKVEIYSVLSEKVFSTDVIEGNTDVLTINTAAFSSGIYFVSIKTAGGIVTKKLVVQR